MLGKDALIEYFRNIFNDSVLSEMDLFGMPSAFLALKELVLKEANNNLNNNKNKIENGLSSSKISESRRSKFSSTSNIDPDEISRFVKTDNQAKDIFKQASNDVDNNAVSDIVKACGNQEEYYKNKRDKLFSTISSNQFSPESFIEEVNNQNDFNQKVNNIPVKNVVSNQSDTQDSIILYAAMVYVIINYIIDYIEVTTFPSTYRSSYLQKLIRHTSAYINNTSNSVGQLLLTELESLQNTLQKLDGFVVALTAAYFIYETNRNRLQRSSSDELARVSKELSCEENPKLVLTDEDIQQEAFENATTLNTTIEGISKVPLNTPWDSSILAFTCPIDRDDEITPHQPFEEKLKEFTCPIDIQPSNEEVTENIIDNTGPTNKSDLSTKALIENLSNDNFDIFVRIGDVITKREIIANIGGDDIWSPVLGEIYKIENDKIYVKDIAQLDTDFVGEFSDKISKKYQTLSNIKEFIKNFYIESLFPVFVNSSPYKMPDWAETSIINAIETINYVPEPLINQIVSFLSNDIEYVLGGIQDRYDPIKKEADDAKDTYNNNAKNIAGEDNVKAKSESENMQAIKDELESEEALYFNTLRNLKDRGVSESSVTIYQSTDNTLSEYYIELYSDLTGFYDNNDIVTTYSNRINDIIINRVFKEGYNIDDIKVKINEYANKLADTKNDYYYDNIETKYETGRETSVENYLKELAKGNDEIDDKEALIRKTKSFFLLLKEIERREENNITVDSTIEDLLNSEANFIDGYFIDLWSKYNSIQSEIDNLINDIKSKTRGFVQPSSIRIDGEDFEYYGLKGPERECPEPEVPDENLSNFTSYGMDSIIYWLKYCGIATLVGITNPLGWSTGLPPPVGPTLFPVVYLPIVSFYSKYGFLVIGLTITGTWIFPFVLFSNLSPNYKVPIVDPTGFIQAQITALKNELISSLKQYRTLTLQSYMDETRADIDFLNNKLDNLKEDKSLLRTNKPRKERPETLRTNAEYISSLANWNTNLASINEEIALTRLERFKLETKYKIFYEAQKETPVESDISDPEIVAIKKTEEFIDKRFDDLNNLIGSIDNFLAPLPISLTPQSASFAFTVKNPKPVIKIKEDISSQENINTQPVNKLIEKLNISSESLMLPNFSNTIGNTIINANNYNNAISPFMPLIIPFDAFPRYENLKITNIAWTVAFLWPHWAPVGAKAFGYPGFPPLPT